MSETFNLSRFTELFAKHSAEHIKSYLMSLGVLVGVLVLGGGFLFQILEARLDVEELRAMYLVVGLLAGTVFTSTIFSELGDKRRAVSWLSLPATHLEKFLVAWLYSYFFFFLVYSGLFYLIANFFLNTVKGRPHRPFTLFFPEIAMVLTIFSFLQALALYGAVRFRNLHFIRTGFIFLIAFLLLIVLNNAVLKVMTGVDLDLVPPLTKLKFSYEGRLVLLEPSPGWHPLLPIAIAAVLLWVAAYFRITEKEI